jgi:hypothetical protein
MSMMSLRTRVFSVIDNIRFNPTFGATTKITVLQGASYIARVQSMSDYRLASAAPISSTSSHT